MRSPLHPDDPSRLGPYALMARLGEGGMGTVYLGQSTAGRFVAIKVIRNEYAREDRYRRRFRSEVNRARQVPPFCTAEVLDADPDHTPPYLVVEYIDGPNLTGVIQEQGPLALAGLHSMAVGMATALTAIHGAGVIHRDLKPGNVLFTLGGIKVIDFGIARPLEATSHHTRTDHMVGTIAYMAPERFEPESAGTLSPAADIFSWGAVVAYAATGRTPFSADSAPGTVMRILTRPPDLTGIPEPIRELVERALAKDPRDRPTARELLDLLLASAPSPAGPLPSALPATPPPASPASAPSPSASMPPSSFARPVSTPPGSAPVGFPAGPVALPTPASSIGGAGTPVGGVPRQHHEVPFLREVLQEAERAAADAPPLTPINLTTTPPTAYRRGSQSERQHTSERNNQRRSRAKLGRRNAAAPTTGTGANGSGAYVPFSNPGKTARTANAPGEGFFSRGKWTMRRWLTQGGVALSVLVVLVVGSVAFRAMGDDKADGTGGSGPLLVDGTNSAPAADPTGINAILKGERHVLLHVRQIDKDLSLTADGVGTVSSDKQSRMAFTLLPSGGSFLIRTKDRVDGAQACLRVDTDGRDAGLTAGDCTESPASLFDLQSTGRQDSVGRPGFLVRNAAHGTVQWSSDRAELFVDRTDESLVDTEFVLLDQGPAS